MAVFATALDDAGVKAIMNSGKPLMTEFPGSYTVRYFAIDSTGNRSLAERTIIVEEDPSAPVMSLIGGLEIEYEAGTNFIDPGVAITTGAGEVIEGAVTLKSKALLILPLLVLMSFTTASRTRMKSLLFRKFVQLL